MRRASARPVSREVLARLAECGSATRWVSATASSAAVPLGCLAHRTPGGPPADPTSTLDGIVARPSWQVSDTALRARLEAALAVLLCWRGRLAAAEEHARRVVDVPEASDLARGVALLALMGVMAVRGGADEVTALSEQARERLARTGAPWPTWIAVDNREILALRLAGRLDEAERVIGRNVRRGEAGHPSAR